MKKPQTIYIAGAISNDPLYRWKFHRVAEDLKARGYVVANPTVLPEEFPYESLIRMGRAMLDECDAIYILKDWKTSHGAQYEYGRAVATGKIIIMQADDEAVQTKAKENDNAL